MSVNATWDLSDIAQAECIVEADHAGLSSDRVMLDRKGGKDDCCVTGERAAEVGSCRAAFKGKMTSSTRSMLARCGQT